ncbi:hypothetical protein Tco_0044744 [Tanacetum coccineum]
MLTKPQVFYDNNLKQALGFQNPFYLKKAQQIRPMLYDGSVIAKETNVISIADSEETLMLEEESRSKMLLKQNFGKRFVPQQELSDEQAFRLQTSHPNTDQPASSPVKIEAPRELPKEKVFVITTLKSYLRKFKGNGIVDNAAQVSNATTIAPGMYKLDPITLAPKDKNNRETHIYYLKHIMKQASILREIVEQAKSLNPLDNASYSACKYIKMIQELLRYVRDTCPDIHKPSEKLVAVTPINKKKIVSSMFDARHELCFLEFVYDMNASSKSKSVNKAKKKEEWKSAGKVFTKIGYNWRPTGRTFTLVKNVCPLTRITATNKVPLRELIPLEVVAQESVVTKVYTMRPKVPMTNGSNSKPKIAKSVISNKTEPVHLGNPILQLLHLLLLLSISDLVSCDGLCGYDWSDQVEEWPNYALMAFSSSSPDSKISNVSICSKSCLETVKLLKSQNDQLLKDLKKYESSFLD